MVQSKIPADSSSQENDIKVMIVDDHPLMRYALKAYLEGESDILIVAEASDGEEAVKKALELIPDVIIMDIEMPKLNGLEATRRIKAQNPNIKILALTVHDDSEHILKLLEAGAAGYITKATFGEKLARAVRAIINGDSVLSADVMDKLLKHSLRYPLESKNPDIENLLSVRELQIFKLAAKGLKDKEIAEQLSLNVRTIKGYLATVYAKLNVNSRTEAMVVALKNGLLKINDLA